MTTYLDRCAAVTAALQDLARDLEADLGKLARARGTSDGTTKSLASLRDPGPDLETFAKQKAQHPMASGLSVLRVTRAYGDAAELAGPMVHANAPAGDDLAARTTVHDLIASIRAVRNHDDATALVASFEGA